MEVIDYTEKVKLPGEFRTKWLEALRSGRYEQATGALYNYQSGGYCCLGVACDIVGIDLKDEKVGKYLSEDYPRALFEEDRHQNAKKIPEALLYERDFYRDLADKNDSNTMTFLDIADYIEQITELE